MRSFFLSYCCSFYFFFFSLLYTQQKLLEDIKKKKEEVMRGYFDSSFKEKRKEKKKEGGRDPTRKNALCTLASDMRRGPYKRKRYETECSFFFPPFFQQLSRSFALRVFGYAAPCTPPPFFFSADAYLAMMAAMS